jgi:hypothetical protein
MVAGPRAAWHAGSESQSRHKEGVGAGNRYMHLDRRYEAGRWSKAGRGLGEEVSIERVESTVKVVDDVLN